MSAPAEVFVHPLALCESEAVGGGTRIWAFAHVMKGAVVGENCNIGGHAFLEAGVRVGNRVTIKNQAMLWDGVEIEDDVFVGPGVCFTNDRLPRSRQMPPSAVTGRCRDRLWLAATRVEQGASLGARSVVLPGITVGAYAMVAAAAVVARDVPAHALVMGAPAKRTGWVCCCGRHLEPLSVAIWGCPECTVAYSEAPDGSGLVEHRQSR